MTKQSRTLLIIAVLALGTMYIFPIWKINLDAPQYPEGIGMYIRINDIHGIKPNDLDNINGLNHYIGMKRIEPDSITELKVMPWIIGLLMAFGLLAALTGKRWMLYTWVASFIIIAIVGLVDFYLWEYDYGHNLNPRAAIKVPGMSYQPPLIGSKQLLNFTAHSWPALGGWMAFLAMALGLWAVYIEVKRRKNKVSVA
ncbi:hypothetical protein [Rhodocaloribacter sp.]